MKFLFLKSIEEVRICIFASMQWASTLTVSISVDYLLESRPVVSERKDLRLRGFLCFQR